MSKWKLKGNYNGVRKFLNHISNADYLNILDDYGKLGVAALQAYTPKDTGLTANSWTYEIEHNEETTKIAWYNTNIQNGMPIAIMLQYGHGTGTGGYVQGVDYINPAMQPIFDAISRQVWNEVTRS